MATFREIIYDVREKYNAYSDDSNLSDEHIAFVVTNVRNTMSKQQMSNLKRSVPKEALQVICVPLAPDTQCFDEIDVVKSTVALPSTLDSTGRSDLHKIYASGSRFVKNINIVDYARLPFLASEKYNHTQLYVSVDHHSDLVVYNSDGNHLMLQQLEVEALFENPEKAYQMSCDYDKNVDFMDVQYPVDSSIIFPMVQQVVQDLLIKEKAPEDLINDGEDITPAPEAKSRNS